MATNNPPATRPELRQHLLQARRDWMNTPAAAQAQADLQERVLAVLAQLEPECLGLYWPMQGEFNPMAVASTARSEWACQLALPYARKSPIDMHYRAWDGNDQPDTRDECNIPSTKGKPVRPDVVLVPCVGFTPEGWRLGYGGGYFDRFMQAHPDVTAVGVAWDLGKLEAATLAPETHDIPLVLVLTESNSWSA
ncbi:MAG TPA: 5-formyltetrahydrofolate cyclo-ligase [Aquabacterium sp.]|uniref:5-formyltetrahydrofolate cyclo-ligase n=1 Tax=Aquabacterium sp. TaxID=1872578 RepID=UPI002E33A6DF|nr:5-formyltetrahydrofolate cyclo-ligase [Aquabacterium sp.]HEX5356892.1 5-formyltetrahydrofolate cyclo-ligase [Aquabacterium sp.]